LEKKQSVINIDTVSYPSRLVSISEPL